MKNTFKDWIEGMRDGLQITVHSKMTQNINEITESLQYTTPLSEDLLNAIDELKEKADELRGETK